MLWSRIRIVCGTLVLVTLAAGLGCGFKRKLVEIQIQPPTATFLTPNPSGQIDFTALGLYIHPPDQHDITSRVTWKTDVPQLLTINGGVASPQGVCGIADISASMQQDGNLVIGYATVTINDPTNPICPGGSTTQGVVTVSLGGTGAGSVTSSPAGIACPATACGAQFTVGTTIALTATPTAGHSLTGWSNNCAANGNTCSVLVVQGSTGVIATFN